MATLTRSLWALLVIHVRSFRQEGATNLEGSLNLSVVRELPSNSSLLHLEEQVSALSDKAKQNEPVLLPNTTGGAGCPSCECGLDDGLEFVEKAVGWQRIPLLYKRIAGVVATGLGIAGIIAWQRSGGKPIKTAAYLPSLLQCLIPRAFQQIQDMDHLALIIGFCFGVGILIYSGCNVMEVIVYQGGCLERGCILEVITLCWMIPGCMHVYTYITYYDDRFATRRQEAEKKKKEMNEMYMTMLDETETKLKSASETSNGFAEKSVNSGKRDFERFLQRTSSLTGDEAAQTSEPMTRYVKQWLKHLEETTLDPVSKPRRGDNSGDTFLDLIVGKAGEKVNLQEAAKKLRERLREEKIGFIETEKAKLETKRTSFQGKMSSLEEVAKDKVKDIVGDTPSFVVCGQKTGFGVKRLETTRKVPAVSYGASESEKKAPFEGEESAYPCVVMGGCCEVTINSPAHLTVLLGLLLGPMMLIAYLVDGYIKRSLGKNTSHVAIQWALVVFSISLFVINYHIERIDQYMRLEKEIAELDQARDNIVEQRVRIRQFFGRSQRVVDFWLGRTIPMFELYSEFQERLKDQFGRDVAQTVQQWMKACDCIDAVLERIGTVSEWWDKLQSVEDQIAQMGEDEPDKEEEEEQKKTSAFGVWVRNVLGGESDIRRDDAGDLAALVSTVESAMPKLKKEVASASFTGLSRPSNCQ